MNLLIDLYPFQKEGVEFYYKKRWSLCGDKMGTGKTAQAIALACKAQAKRVLVVCPAFLQINWRQEIEKFCDEPKAFDIVSYTSLGKIKSLEPYDLLIADEVHAAKNIKAKRTKTLHNLLRENPPKFFLGLSGTPIKNNVGEFFSLLLLCHHGGRYPEFDYYCHSYWLFNSTFMHKKTLFLGGRKIQKFEGLKNVPDLKRLIKPVYLRRKSEDVLDLPEMVDREIVISDKAKTDALLKTAWESYKGKKASKSFASGKAVSALAKVPYTVDVVKEILEEEDRVVIYTDHVSAAKKIHSEFDPQEARYITGEVNMTSRQGFVKDLNDGKIKILVATIGALSEGVTMATCNQMVFNDHSWVPADNEQAKKRIHRIGQTRTCVYHHVFASKYDQVIHKTLKAKQAIIEETDT